MAKKKPASPDAKPKAVKKTSAVSGTDSEETHPSKLQREL